MFVYGRHRYAELARDLCVSPAEPQLGQDLGLSSAQQPRPALRITSSPPPLRHLSDVNGAEQVSGDRPLTASRTSQGGDQLGHGQILRQVSRRPGSGSIQQMVLVCEWAGEAHLDGMAFTAEDLGR